MAIPTVTSITPAGARTGGRRLVRIVGSNFQLPPEPPLYGVTPQANPSVEVLFGTVPAREVQVLSPEILQVLTPVHDPGVVSITVRNITQDGDVIDTETAELEDAFTFTRPELKRSAAEECTLQRVVRYLILDLRRQIIDNVELTVHTDYADAPDGANVAMLATIPGLVLVGPRLKEDRFLSTNATRKTENANGSMQLLRPPRTVDLEFTLIGVDDHAQNTLALMSEVVAYFQRNTMFAIPMSEADPTGEQSDYELEIDDMFAWTGAPGNSNIRAFSGTFVIRGVDIDDEDMAFGQSFVITDVVPAGTPLLNIPGPATQTIFQLPPDEE